MAMRRFEESTSTSPVVDDATVLQQELDQRRQEFLRHRENVTVIMAVAGIIMAIIAMAYRPQPDHGRLPKLCCFDFLLLGGAVGTYIGRSFEPEWSRV